ncbi:Acetoacetyl-CoA synthetase, partial [Tolypocladium paradoxum]
MELETTPRKLWEHPNPKGTAMWEFMQEANRRYGLELQVSLQPGPRSKEHPDADHVGQGFHDLYRWSCEQRSQFYGQLWDSQRWIHEGSFAQVVDEATPISRLPRWFAGVRLNWAENFLWSRGPGDAAGTRATLHKEDARVALTEVREGNTAVVDV